MEEDLDVGLLQEGSTSSDRAITQSKTCSQRSEEREDLLNAYQAARRVHSDSSEYGIVDDSTAKLVTTWQKLYKKSQTEWAFHCTQTKDDLQRVAAAVREQEAIAVENAAHAGLVAAEAAMREKKMANEKASKISAEHKKKAASESMMKKSIAQEQADKIAKETIAKDQERLKTYEQLTSTLYGVVKDGATGKAINSANVTAICLFKTSFALTRADGKFTISGGISGPTGRQCKIKVAKVGFVTTEFPFNIIEGDTDSKFAQAVLMPLIQDPKRFRFVLQYGTRVPDISAHILVPMVNETFVDVSSSPLVSSNIKIQFGGAGAQDTLPYTTQIFHASHFGPESYSIYRVNDGVYRFLAANDARSFRTKVDFLRSDARAFLYQGNELLETASCKSASGEPENVWDIFSLSCLHAVCSLDTTNRFVKAP